MVIGFGLTALFKGTRNLLVIEKLDKELSAIQKRHDLALQEIGRLESRLQTHQHDHKNESDVLRREV